DGDNEISEWLNGFYTQIRRRGVYYGDSGIFVRRRIYETLGGIRPIALMENYGNTICIDQPALTSSSRRFAGRRKWAIIAGWMMIHVLFYLGVPPGWLAKLYDSHRRRQRAHAAPERTVAQGASFKVQS
ncbi:MAG: hypothetical protein HN650_01415, partial [Rhodospirillaceae bacterium]|nr:hypothetical protein [Rhodospirillaceae bacterium]